MPTATSPLPRGVSSSTTGIFALDVLALATMTACIPTLVIFAKRGRTWDLFTFGLAFAVACAYHLCQMEPTRGLSGDLWGVEGTRWRALDILTAQWILARAAGHAISSRCYAATRAVTELGFPAAVAGMCALGALAKSKEEEFASSASSLASAAAAALSLGACTKALLLVVSSAAALKAALHALRSRGRRPVDGEGEDKGALGVGARGRPFLPHAATPEQRARLSRAVRSVAVGLVFFPLPELFPELYFLFHSLWHLAMARGFLCLYTLIEGLPEPASPAQAAAAALRAVSAAAGEVASPAVSSLSALLPSASSPPATGAAGSRRDARRSRRRGEGGGHRRVLSVVFEGDEGEEGDEVVVLEEDGGEEEASPSSSDVAAVGGSDACGGDGGEGSSTDDEREAGGGREEATTEEATKGATVETCAAKTGSSPPWLPVVAQWLPNVSRGELVDPSSRGRRALPFSPPPSFSSSSPGGALGTLSSFLEAWASGGAPSMSSSLRASFVKRQLDAARAFPGETRRRLLGISVGGTPSLSLGEVDGGGGGVDGGGGGKRVVLLRRRRSAAAARDDDAS